MRARFASIEVVYALFRSSGIAVFSPQSSRSPRHRTTRHRRAEISRAPEAGSDRPSAAHAGRRPRGPRPYHSRSGGTLVTSHMHAPDDRSHRDPAFFPFVARCLIVLHTLTPTPSHQAAARPFRSGLSLPPRYAPPLPPLPTPTTCFRRDAATTPSAPDSLSLPLLALFAACTASLDVPPNAALTPAS